MAALAGPNYEDWVLRQRISDLYGPAMLTLMDRDAELQAVLMQGARENRDETWVQSRLRGTQWYRNTAESARQWDLLSAEQPEEASRRLNERARQVLQMAQRFGATVSYEARFKIAEDSLRMGWTDDQINDTVAGYYRSGTTSSGDVVATSNQLKALAAQYLVDPGNTDNLAVSIVQGSASLDGYRAMYQQQAKARFSYLSDVIDQGVTLADYFQPYKQMVAKELEITPDSVNLNDSKWLPLLGVPDGKGGTRAMTLSEAQRWARQRPEWSGTQGAKDQAAALADTITRTFGGVA